MTGRLAAAGLIGFLTAIPATYVARVLARRVGMVARPKSDRWHAREVPMLGGFAIIVSTLVPMALLVRAWDPALSTLLAAALFLGGLGLLDDRRAVRPSTKFAVQLACASVLVYSGFRIDGTEWAVLNSVVGIAWIVGITNAFNLLDNMDGLCAGIATIASVAFVVERVLSGAGGSTDVIYAMSLAGALVGFLLYNFNPASIFMGDAGSLFIGVSLAALTIMPGVTARANVVSVLAVPALLLAIPIFDTAYVTIMRKAAGRPASQGGRDHTSHRLVALGFSERRAVVLLYALGAAAGMLAIFVRRFGIQHVNVVVALLLLVLLLVALRLSQLQIYEGAAAPPGSGTTPLLVSVMYKRRILEIALDAALIILAYYGAFWVRFENLGPSDFRVYFAVFQRSLPLVLACKIVAFLGAGIYGGVWRYFSLSDLGTYIKGIAAGSVASVLAVLLLFRFEQFSRAVFAIDFMFLTLLVVGSRISFRALGDAAQRSSHSGRKALVYGAGDAGTLVVRELLNNKSHDLRPVGFVDDDPAIRTSRIHGFPVLGGVDDIPRLIAEHDVEAIVVSTGRLLPERAAQLELIAHDSGTVVQRFEFRLETLARTRD